MGDWANDIAKGDAWVHNILRGVPGPMCPKINEWACVGASRYTSGGTKLGRERDYEDDLPDLYATAAAIRDERDAAFDGLQECRTALEMLRTALCEAIDQLRTARADIENAAAFIDRLDSDVSP